MDVNQVGAIVLVGANGSGERKKDLGRNWYTLVGATVLASLNDFGERKIDLGKR